MGIAIDRVLGFSWFASFSPPCKAKGGETIVCFIEKDVVIRNGTQAS